MSTDKYAQYISEQQRNLRVSGTNPVELTEKKKMTKDDIAGLAEPKGKFDHKDLAALRAKKHLKKEEVEALDEDDHDDEGWNAHHETGGEISRQDWKKGVRMNSKGERVQTKTKIKTEEVEQIDEETLGSDHKSAITKHMKKMWGKGNISFDKQDGKHFVSHSDGVQTHVHSIHMKKGVPHVTHFMSMDEEINEQEVNTAGKSNKMASAPATVTTLKPLNKPGLPKLSGMTVAQKGAMKAEEVEEVDEGMTRASKGKKASLVHTLAIKPGKVPYRGKGTIPKAQNINNSYEMSDEEADYIEEAVGKGQLPSILKHHEANMKHHQKLMTHHMKLADASEDIGDHESFDHHTTKAMEHEYDAMSHKRRFDHAASLGDKVKAMKQMKSASKDMAAASDKLAKARENKRDY